MGLIGAHVSIAGGIENAPNRGTLINANSIQIFTANQNQWFPKDLALPAAPRTARTLKRMLF